jgi:hypothetical protein
MSIFKRLWDTFGSRGSPHLESAPHFPTALTWREDFLRLYVASHPIGIDALRKLSSELLAERGSDESVRHMCHFLGYGILFSLGDLDAGTRLLEEYHAVADNLPAHNFYKPVAMLPCLLPLPDHLRPRPGRHPPDFSEYSEILRWLRDDYDAVVGWLRDNRDNLNWDERSGRFVLKVESLGRNG